MAIQQHKSHCVNITGRSWRNRKTNRITPMHRRTTYPHEPTGCHNSTTSGWISGEAGTNNTTTHVPRLSATTRRNEQLRQIPKIDNTRLDQILASNIHSNFNLRNQITKNITILLISIFLHWTNLHRLILLQIGRLNS